MMTIAYVYSMCVCRFSSHKILISLADKNTNISEEELQYEDAEVAEIFDFFEKPVKKPYRPTILRGKSLNYETHRVRLVEDDEPKRVEVAELLQSPMRFFVSSESSDADEEPNAEAEMPAASASVGKVDEAPEAIEVADGQCPVPQSENGEVDEELLLAEHATGRQVSALILSVHKRRILPFQYVEC